MSYQYYTYVQNLGGQVYFRGINKDNKRVTAIIKNSEYHPSVYVKGDGEFKCIDGTQLSEVTFKNIKDAKEYVKHYSNVQKIYGMLNFTYTFIADTFPNKITYNPALIRVFYIDIENLISDDGFLAPERAATPITAITIFDSLTQRYTCFTFNETQDVFETSREDLDFYIYATEEDMLEHFVNFWKMNCPEVVSGWNCGAYDIPFIYHRVFKILGEDKAASLSPFNYATSRMVKTGFNNKEQCQVNLYGISILDYLDLYKKFTYSGQESYRLDHISYMELGEKKVDYKEFGNLNDLYYQNFQKFIEYNIHDVALVVRLNQKLKFLNIVYDLAYLTKVNYIDTLGVVKIWDVYIYNFLREKGYVIPPEHNMHGGQFEGAYVKDPIVGLHEWIVTLDAGSLYPSLIRQLNMSAETLIPKGSTRANEINKELGCINIDTLLAQEPDLSVLKKYNVCLAANGALFDLSIDGFLPEVMNTILSSRKRVKGLMLQRQQEAEDAKKQGVKYDHILDEIAALDAQQMAFKILANSGYGAIANQHFRYFKLEIAEAITVSGQLCIKWVEKIVNEYLDTVTKIKKDRITGIDTDSLMLTMNDIVKLIFPTTLPETSKIVHVLDDYCKKKLNPLVDQATKDLAEYLNSKEHLVFFKREKIADKGLFIAKKRYVLSVWNNEGVTYAAPKLKIMGIEAVKSSTPEICRNAMKEALPIILYKDLNEMKSFIDKFKEQFYNSSLEAISFPRSVNNISKYTGTDRIYTSGTPMHVRAALLYNFIVNKFNKKSEYELIKNNDKIKFIYLKVPNPLQENVIGFTTKFPELYNLKEYIDYETQFNKTFMDPLQTMTDLLNWNLCQDDTKQSLEEFFM